MCVMPLVPVDSWTRDSKRTKKRPGAETYSRRRKGAGRTIATNTREGSENKGGLDIVLALRWCKYRVSRYVEGNVDRHQSVGRLVRRFKG